VLLVQATGGFPVDLVLFAMVAAFLVLRLRSILGRKTGFEGTPVNFLRRPGAKPTEKVIDGKAEPMAASKRPLPDPAGPVGRALAEIKAADRRFDPAQFLAGAEHAFRMIVAAFAAGDRTKLRQLLADETFAAFDRVISTRDAAGETQRTEIRDIDVVEITEAGLSGQVASIVVRFVSRQINLTLDKSGQPVAGTDAVTEIGDIWTFERRVGQPDPTWRLAAARSV
jgi:predicted lipid-binding transport protein (Tim44 family)